MTTADIPRVEFTHEQAIAAGKAKPRQPMRMVVDYYFVTKGNTLADELKEHFPTFAEAEARAHELNELDVIKERRLTKKQVARAKMLREHSYGRGYLSDQFSWLRKLKRYAVASSWDDGDTCWDTFDTLAEVEEQLQDQRTERVLDLDTGEEISFTREVAVTLK